MAPPHFAFNTKIGGLVSYVKEKETICLTNDQARYIYKKVELVLYNILLLINQYIGNNTTKCLSRSMSDNRDLTGVFHQKISSLPKVIASDSRYFQSS